MVVLEKIKGASLAEAIIAMTLAIFLFGFVAWFFANVDQDRFKKKNEVIFQILVENSEYLFEPISDTLFYPYQLFIHESYLGDDERLIRNEIFLQDRFNNPIYKTHTWLVNQNNLANENK